MASPEIQYGSYVFNYESYDYSLNVENDGLVSYTITVNFYISSDTADDLADDVSDAEDVITLVNQDFHIKLDNNKIVDLEYATIGFPIIPNVAWSEPYENLIRGTFTLIAKAPQSAGGAGTFYSERITMSYTPFGAATITHNVTERNDSSGGSYVNPQKHLSDWIADQSYPLTGYEIISRSADQDKRLKRITVSITMTEILIETPAGISYGANTINFKEFNYNINKVLEGGNARNIMYRYMINGTAVLDRATWDGGGTGSDLPTKTQPLNPDLTLDESNTYRKEAESNIKDAFDTFLNNNTNYVELPVFNWNIGNREVNFELQGIAFMGANGAFAQNPQNAFIELTVSYSINTDYGLQSITIGNKDVMISVSPEKSAASLGVSGVAMGASAQNLSESGLLALGRSFFGRELSGENIHLVSQNVKIDAAEYITNTVKSQNFSANYDFILLNREPTKITKAGLSLGSNANDPSLGD